MLSDVSCRNVKSVKQDNFVIKSLSSKVKEGMITNDKDASSILNFVFSCDDQHSYHFSTTITMVNRRDFHYCIAHRLEATPDTS